MAKDGTNRGGARVGAGRKPKALTEKINTGKHAIVVELPETGDLEGSVMPPVKDYMTADQKNGQDFCAKEVYEETWNWLKDRGCQELVSPQILQQYAMSVARWIQCETAISEYGFLAKHPTTGAAISSPYVTMSREYMKQVNQCWYQIFQVVKENCSTEFQGASPQDDLMERLLKARKIR
jgi:hypothetical protein